MRFWGGGLAKRLYAKTPRRQDAKKGKRRRAMPPSVIPAQAGIQRVRLDSRLRGNDGGASAMTGKKSEQ